MNVTTDTPHAALPGHGVPLAYQPCMACEQVTEWCAAAGCVPTPADRQQLHARRFVCQACREGGS